LVRPPVPESVPESVMVLAAVSNVTEPLRFVRFRFKDDAQLWWVGGKPGDKLDLALPVKEKGRYEISVVLTKAPDYGIVQFYVNGKKAGKPIDLYGEKVTNTEPMALGTFELPKGEQKLSVEIAGANEKAVKSYMFGIDQILVKKTSKE